MRLLLFLLLALALNASPVTPPEAIPDDLRTALANYRAEGTRGWAFTQSTRASGKGLVERYDPRLPEFRRWSLLQKDGRAPTEQERQTYAEQQTRRSRGDTAPNVKEQIDEATAERLQDDGTRVHWRFRLRTTEEDDRSAAHMTATFVLHRPTSTIERMELASFEPFKPVTGIAIDQARTVVEYSLPEGDRPTLLQRITVTLRGRAWWIKSLDDDMEVVYSDFESARPAQR
jgi:hypothetical protein